MKEQKLYSGDLEYVFPAMDKRNKTPHISRDTISNAVRDLGGKDRFKGKATSHGFRSTFRTICTLNLAELMQLGISEKTIENAVSHTEKNRVIRAYERQTATTEQNKILMQWYGDYLNSIEPLGI